MKLFVPVGEGSQGVRGVFVRPPERGAEPEQALTSRRLTRGSGGGRRPAEEGRPGAAAGERPPESPRPPRAGAVRAGPAAPLRGKGGPGRRRRWKRAQDRWGSPAAPLGAGRPVPARRDEEKGSIVAVLLPAAARDSGAAPVGGPGAGRSSGSIRSSPRRVTGLELSAGRVRAVARADKSLTDN